MLSFSSPRAAGQHVKEFRDFLLRWEDEFVVGEETIFLKEFEGTCITRTKLCSDEEEGSECSRTTEANAANDEQALKTSTLEFLKNEVPRTGDDLDLLQEKVAARFPATCPFRTVQVRSKDSVLARRRI